MNSAEIEVISNCLAPCEECTGRYISETLEKQFICDCKCHRVASDDSSSDNNCKKHEHTVGSYNGSGYGRGLQSVMTE
jgi:hypothetical protein